MKHRTLLICMPFVLIACAAPFNPLGDFEPVEATTVLSAPAPDNTKTYDPEVTKRGKYLVELLGCGACHTDRALLGEPNMDLLLAGSSVGLAHSNPLTNKNPAVVFPSNLTPDNKTGIGSVSDEALTRAIRGGAGRHGVRSLRVMPVAAYSRITEDDVEAIVAYLRSLKPIRHRVPDSVREGQKSKQLYVHFGVYRNREN